jgi:hypothetical protein
MRWRGDALFLERLTAITPTLLRTSEDVPHGVRVTLRDNDMFAFLEALLQNWAPLELGPIESRYYDN